MNLQLMMKLIPILCQIESGNYHMAVGDNGEAIGVLQIHKCVVDDVNRVYGKNFSYDDRMYVSASKLICLLYIGYWGRKYYENYGKEPTMETYAKIWNAGPRGYEKQKAEKYWEKVKELLK